MLLLNKQKNQVVTKAGASDHIISIIVSSLQKEEKKTNRKYQNSLSCWTSPSLACDSEAFLLKSFPRTSKMPITSITDIRYQKLAFGAACLHSSTILTVITRWEHLLHFCHSFSLLIVIAKAIQIPFPSLPSSQSSTRSPLSKHKTS